MIFRKFVTALAIVCLLSQQALAAQYIIPSIGPAYPGNVPGLVWCDATTSVVRGNVGNLFDLTRASDQTTQTIVPIAPGGPPDLAAIKSFLNDGVGVGYISKLYNQCGAGSTLLPAFNGVSSLASAPKINLSRVLAGAPAMVCDYFNQNYLAGLTPAFVTYPVSGFSSNVVTLSVPIPTWWIPGVLVSGGANMPATPVTAINFIKQQITVVTGPTGAISALTIAVPKEGLDLPSTVSIPLNNHAIFTVGVQPPTTTYTNPVTVGTTVETALSSATNYAMMRLSGVSAVTLFRSIVQTGGANAGFSLGLSLSAVPVHSYPTVYGYTRNYRTINYWSEELAGSTTVAADPGNALASSGSLGFSQQFTAAGGVFGCDHEAYGHFAFGYDIGAGYGNFFTPILKKFFGGLTDPAITVVFNGSSKTQGGRGYPQTEQFGRFFCDTMIASGRTPCRALNTANGQSIEAANQVYSTIGPGVFHTSSTPLLVEQGGVGNSIQASVTVPVASNTATSMTATVAQSYPSFASVGAFASVAGTGTCPTNTQITAVDTPLSSITFTVSSDLSACIVTSFTVLNDTGPQVCAAYFTLLDNERASGYKVIAILESSRGTFTTQQAIDFNLAAACIRAGVSAHSDGFVDVNGAGPMAGDTPWITSPQDLEPDLQHWTGPATNLQTGTGYVANQVIQTAINNGLYH